MKNKAFLALALGFTTAVSHANAQDRNSGGRYQISSGAAASVFILDTTNGNLRQCYMLNATTLKCRDWVDASVNGTIAVTFEDE